MYEHGSQSEIIDIHDVYAKQLNNYRTIHVYLPPAYRNQPMRRFPVLYTHDGQNMFDGQYSYSGASWRIQHAVDELIDRGLIEDIIIVAIDNMQEERLSEYAHDDGSFQGVALKGTGLRYENFLIHDLKPYIDANFRTCDDARNTALMGSSMGGLVTYNIGTRHPEIFGKLAIMSPSFWWGEDVTLQRLKNRQFKMLNEKIWIDMGDAEGQFMYHCREVVHELLKKGYHSPGNLAYYSVPGANHSESAWADRVHCPLLYFFGQIGKPQALTIHGRDCVGIVGPTVQLNPVISFDTGFYMTALNATYTVEQSQHLAVDQMGNLTAKLAGETTVNIECLGLTAVKTVKIVDRRSATVVISINVDVPQHTPDGPIYMGVYDARDYSLERGKDGSYSTQIALPRDNAISFKFTCGDWDTVEKNATGGDIDSRLILPDDDRTLYYRVENWAD